MLSKSDTRIEIFLVKDFDSLTIKGRDISRKKKLLILFLFRIS